LQQVALQQVGDVLDRHISRRKAAITRSIGKDRLKVLIQNSVTLEALGDPVTYSQRVHVNSEVASIGTDARSSRRGLFIWTSSGN
jgi:hypothetical protein